MGRKWGDIQNEILGLMFSNNTGGSKAYVSDATNMEYAINMADSFNCAMADIHSSVKPYRRYIDINVANDEDLKAYDLRNIKDVINYMAIIPEEVFIVLDNNLKSKGNFEIVAGDIFIPGEKGVWRIYYKSLPDKVTEETIPEFVIEDDDMVISACCYFSASRLFLEDDLAISTQYLNMYENFKNTIYGIENKNSSGSGSLGFENKRGWI